MSKTYKFTVTLVLLTIVFLGLCLLINYKSLWLILTVFWMPVLWILWLTCVAFDAKKNIKKIILLWLLIDIAALLNLAMLIANSNKAGSQDNMDYVLAIAFSPLILPDILAFAFFPILADGLLAIMHVLPLAHHASLLYDWLGGSIMSAVSSCLFVCLCYFWKITKERRR